MSIQELARPRPERVTSTDIVIRQGIAEKIRACGYAELSWSPEWTLAQSQALRDGLWRMTEGPKREIFKYARASESDDQGLFEKQGELKPSPTTLEIAEGRLRYDSKWYFHCYDTTKRVLREQLAPTEEYREFFEANAECNRRARLLALAIAGRLDELNEREPDPAKRHAASLLDHFVGSKVVTRTLRYKEGSEGATVAQVHRDRCALSLQWIGIPAGLRLFTQDKRPVDVQDGDPSQVCVFLGEKVWKLTRGKLGTGVVHGATNRVSCKPGEERFVMVTFVHCALDQSDLDWGEKHKAELVLDHADYPL